MKSLRHLVPLLAALTASAGAATPPAEKLLPPDTLAMLTAPGWQQARRAFEESATGRLWADPAMKAFKDHFQNRLKSEWLAPLERDLGVNPADLGDLLQGQVTLALTRSGWQGGADASPAWVLIVDAGEKQGLLEKKLAELRQKWVAAGKPLKTESLRGLEFSTLILEGGAPAVPFKLPGASAVLPGPGGPGGAAPDASGAEPKRKTELTIGHSGSLLIAGSSPAEIEKLLIRQSGGTLPSLADEPDFEANRTARFRNAVLFGWVHFKLISEVLLRKPAEESAAAAPANPFALRPDRILAALGLDSLRWISFNLDEISGGHLMNVHLGVPESDRRGVFKILATEARDAGPPSFVPADAVKFSRWRADGQKLWTSLETILADISPELSGMVQLILGAAGKDTDERFDLKKSVVANLGSDFLSYEKAPRPAKPGETPKAPSIYFLGSPNAEALATGLRVAATLMPPPMNNVRDRDFLGRKVYTMRLAPERKPGGGIVDRNLYFSASSGYLALSTDLPLLEEFLRSSGSTAKSLREQPGLNDAAQQVGGMGTGWFGFENQQLAMRAALTSLKDNPAAFGALFGGAAVPGLARGTGTNAPAAQWINPALLPPFDTIARYFHYTVSAGAAQRDGISFKTFAPHPPPAAR
jgi:hypothetical protein